MTRDGEERSRRVGTDAVTQARREELTDRARERHDVLTAAIDRLERALAAPAFQRAKPWSERVAADLEVVREAIRAHVDDVEGGEGLFDEIEREAPRLGSRLAALREDHSFLLTRASRLADRLPGDENADFSSLRREASILLVALREHRAAEADLVYEAFWTDLGACD